MSRLCVTPEELSSFASRLDALAGALGDARAMRGDQHGACGSRRVEARLDEFFEQWSGGIQRVQDGLHRLSGNLAAAGEAYSTVESDIETKARAGVRQAP